MAVCGNCKSDAEGVEEIRACYAGHPNPHARGVRQDEPERVYINVPYADKDEAKRQIHAKWDPQKRSWWVPSGTAVPNKWLGQEQVKAHAGNGRGSLREPEEGFYRIMRDGAEGIEGSEMYDFFKVYRSQHGMTPGQVIAKKLSVTVDRDRNPVGRWNYIGKSMNTAIATHGVLLTLDEAKTFGRMYGFCMRCGRTLTDEGSIAAGIGPICAGKWHDHPGIQLPGSIPDSAEYIDN